MSQQHVVELKRQGGPSITGNTFATIAEGAIARCREQQGFRYLTTSKLRSIYSLIMNVYVKVNNQQEYVDNRSDIQYLKVRMAYEAGRERSVKEFLDITGLMVLVDSISSFEQFRLYCRYAEALVAYFKFYGGRDK